ncbi:MAG: homoserine O-acetyltransferase [Candidatus Latescibacteria bacterium]|nr:homoserine O-acetyltransferase [Candidatus Latescibacterota bacterium]
MNVRSQWFSIGQPFALANGQTLPNVDLVYETYGQLNAAKDNAILLFHALTGSHHAAGFNNRLPEAGDHWTEECHRGWWDGFVGPGKALDTSVSYIICVNYLGGCYGSTGPASIPPGQTRPLGSHFPSVTLADMVDSQVLLLDHLGIERLHAAVGASLGGLMCLSLATRYPERVAQVIPIAAGLTVTPLQRLINFEQIVAIESDPNFCAGDYYGGQPPRQGLALARIISHKTFVSVHDLEDRARNSIVDTEDAFASYTVNHKLESYMMRQGSRFAARFDANSYLRILEAWQRFDLVGEAGCDSLEEALARCQGQRFLTFSIDSDVCFYPEEQEEMVAALKTAGLTSTRFTVHSEKGHDAFLLEAELFTPQLRYFLYP